MNDDVEAYLDAGLLLIAIPVQAGIQGFLITTGCQLSLALTGPVFVNVFPTRTIRNHSGFALIAVLLVLVTGASFVLLRGLNAAATQSYRDDQTARALAEAKAALIGYAVSTQLIGSKRPGDLLCPDSNNDGKSDIAPDAPCGTSTKRLGRLPWKTMDLPDLRDRSGERLWYAVSTNFKNNPRTSCTSPSDSGCLNSDVLGTITVRAPDGSLVHDGSNLGFPSGVVAVVFSPGKVLKRQDNTEQDRTCGTDTGCVSSDICSGSTPSNTPKCNPQNYLDIALAFSEDNASFLDSTTNGFIQGEVFDANGNVIVNDRLLAITYEDFIPLLEQRVVGETLACLKTYAGRSKNLGKYPWAAKLDSVSEPYPDDTDTRFGRVPDSLTNTESNDMDGSWPSSEDGCNIGISAWWRNWKELIFYGVADAYKPTSTNLSCLPLDSCLTVDPPSTTANHQVVIIAAGKRLQAAVSGGQQRANSAQKSEVTNYLEDENATIPPTDEVLSSGTATPLFNDKVCKSGICL